MRTRGDNVYYGVYVAACVVIGWLMGTSVRDSSRSVEEWYRPVPYVQPRAPRPERKPGPVCPKGQHVASVTFTQGFMTGVTCAQIKVWER
jgi:hypothetical protein